MYPSPRARPTTLIQLQFSKYYQQNNHWLVIYMHSIPTAHPHRCTNARSQSHLHPQSTTFRLIFLKNKFTLEMDTWLYFCNVAKPLMEESGDTSLHYYDCECSKLFCHDVIYTNLPNTLLSVVYIEIVGIHSVQTIFFPNSFKDEWVLQPKDWYSWMHCCFLPLLKFSKYFQPYSWNRSVFTLCRLIFWYLHSQGL